MIEGERGTGESSFDALVRGLDQGAVSRGMAVRTLVAGVMGGLVGRFAGSPLPAKARKKKRLKTLFAVVNADTSLARAKGANAVFRQIGLPKGGYYVDFKQDVNTCAYIATTTNGFPGQVSANDSGAGLPYRVTVNTTDSNGNLADLAFHLVVIC